MTTDLATQILMIAGAIAVLVAVCALAFRVTRPQAPQTQVERPPEQPRVEESVLSGLSQRLASLEGTIGVLRSDSAGSIELVARVAKIEAQLPAIADAYESFVDAFDSKRKRDDTREQRATGKTAADAAVAAFGTDAGAVAPNGPVAPAQAKPSEWQTSGAFVGRGRVKR